MRPASHAATSRSSSASTASDSSKSASRNTSSVSTPCPAGVAQGAEQAERVGARVVPQRAVIAAGRVGPVPLHHPGPRRDDARARRRTGRRRGRDGRRRSRRRARAPRRAARRARSRTRASRGTASPAAAPSRAPRGATRPRGAGTRPRPPGAASPSRSPGARWTMTACGRERGGHRYAVEIASIATPRRRADPRSRAPTPSGACTDEAEPRVAPEPGERARSPPGTGRLVGRRRLEEQDLDVLDPPREAPRVLEPAGGVHERRRADAVRARSRGRHPNHTPRRRSKGRA